MHGAGSRSSSSVMAQPHAAEDWAGSHLANTFSPELRFLLACCVWPHSEAREQQLSRALQTDLDWTHVLRLTERHRVFGLVFDGLSHLLKDAVPEHVVKSVRETTALLTRQTLEMASESVRIARLMEGAEIPVAFLKGVPLAITVYGGLGLRHSRDIDLLVPEKAALVACRTLMSAGYVGATPLERISTDPKLRRWLRDNKHIEYVHKNSGIQGNFMSACFPTPC